MVYHMIHYSHRSGKAAGRLSRVRDCTLKIEHRPQPETLWGYDKSTCWHVQEENNQSSAEYWIHVYMWYRRVVAGNTNISQQSIYTSLIQSAGAAKQIIDTESRLNTSNRHNTESIASEAATLKYMRELVHLPSKQIVHGQDFLTSWVYKTRKKVSIRAGAVAAR